MSMDDFVIDARGVITVLSLVSFLGIVFWAYSRRRADAFEEAANLPFADEEEDIAPLNQTERKDG